MRWSTAPTGFAHPSSRNETEDASFGKGISPGTAEMLDSRLNVRCPRVVPPRLCPPPRDVMPTARYGSGDYLPLAIELSPNIQLPASVTHSPFNKGTCPCVGKKPREYRWSQRWLGAATRVKRTGTLRPASLLREIFLQRQMVASIAEIVFHLVGELPHQMNSESADRPILKIRIQ